MKLVRILLATAGFAWIALNAIPCEAQIQDVDKGKPSGGGKGQDLPIPLSDHSIKEYLEWVSSKWGQPIDGIGEKGYGKREVLDVVSGTGLQSPTKLKTHMWDNAQNSGDIVGGWRFRAPIKDATGVKTTSVASGFMSELLGTARPIHLTAITEFGYDSANKVNFIYVYFDCNNDLENRFQLHELEAKSTGWKVPRQLTLGTMAPTLSKYLG